MAKTKLRVLIWVFIHIGFIITGFFIITDEVQNSINKGYEVNMLTIIKNSFPILLMGLLYPCMYIHAMYRLLKIIRDKEATETKGA